MGLYLRFPQNLSSLISGLKATRYKQDVHDAVDSSGSVNHEELHQARRNSNAKMSEVVFERLARGTSKGASEGGRGLDGRPPFYLDGCRAVFCQIESEVI